MCLGDMTLNFDNSEQVTQEENVNIFINKLKRVNVTTNSYRHTIRHKSTQYQSIWIRNNNFMHYLIQ